MAMALLTASGARADEAAPAVSSPHWLKLPSVDDLGRFWPAGAHGMSGRALISCIVTSRGTLDRCELVSEEPAGQGFGASALLLAPLFAMAPKTVDGVPVGGATVHIPVNFKADGPMFGDSARIANNLPWSAVPTAGEVAAAFPEKAVGKTASGHVLLRCRVTDDGGLKLCQIASEEPRGDGFAQAARDLARTFRVAPELRGSKALRDVFVDVPFDFHDPHQATPPVEVNDPEWLQGVDPAMVARLFPDAAAKAGLKTGRAILGCVVAHDGGLTQCAVSSEEPAGLGFGGAALSVAGVMRMNAWTKQGAPVDGARILLPIRLNIGDDAAPAQTSAAAPQTAESATSTSERVQIRTGLQPPRIPPPESYRDQRPMSSGSRQR
jgi:TonB family protein